MPRKTRNKQYSPPVDSTKSDDKYNELLQKFDTMHSEIVSLRSENEELKSRIESKVNEQSVSVSLGCAFGKDSVPWFDAKTPASQPLKRNSEVEFFLKQVELVGERQDDSVLIRLAKSRCTGIVASIVNSAAYEHIVTWHEFKELIRNKFRGTTTANDYFHFLNALKLAPYQSPQDLYVQIESYAYQAVRDHPSAVGDVNELISRVFLQALPLWLRELVASSEDLPCHKLVEVTNRIWNLRVNSKVDNQIAASTVSSQGSYCAYHRCNGHTTRECRSKPSNNVCWRCGKPGHVRLKCPFSQNQASENDDREAEGSSH